MDAIWNYTYIEPNCDNVSHVFQSFDGYCVTVQDILGNSVLSLVGFIIIALNAWILNILSRHYDRLDPSNLFIANLAVADLLIGVFVLYDVIYAGLWHMLLC